MNSISMAVALIETEYAGEHVILSCGGTGFSEATPVSNMEFSSSVIAEYKFGTGIVIAEEFDPYTDSTPGFTYPAETGPEFTIGDCQ